MRPYQNSELIITEDQSIYHLNLRPEDIADDIILVGDPGRVSEISSQFDHIELRKSNREFTTHTGYIGNKRLTVVSSGIGTDNIDIVLNELDALANIDLESRRDHAEHRSLNLIRLGTSGALHSSIEVDSFIISKYALGMDGLAHFYDLPANLTEQEAADTFIKHTNWSSDKARPYVIENSSELDNKFPGDIRRGITITAPGFYGPQGRQLRLPVKDSTLNSRMGEFSYNGYPVSNYEMETSALYALGKSLGHNTMTICAIIANRPAGTYSKDHKKTIKQLIDTTLNQLTT